MGGAVPDIEQIHRESSKSSTMALSTEPAAVVDITLMKKSESAVEPKTVLVPQMKKGNSMNVDYQNMPVKSDSVFEMPKDLTGSIANG